jgi:hypothetical protein
MGTRTIFEINHDMTHAIEDDPEAFVKALVYYLGSASDRNAESLRRFGLRRAWWGSSYDERKVVSKYEETVL